MGKDPEDPLFLQGEERRQTDTEIPLANKGISIAWGGWKLPVMWDQRPRRSTTRINEAPAAPLAAPTAETGATRRAWASTGIFHGALSNLGGNRVKVFGALPSQAVRVYLIRSVSRLLPPRGRPVLTAAIHGVVQSYYGNTVAHPGRRPHPRPCLQWTPWAPPAFEGHSRRGRIRTTLGGNDFGF